MFSAKYYLTVFDDWWTEIVQFAPDSFDDTKNPIEIGTPEDLAWFISYVNGRAGYGVNHTIGSHSDANANDIALTTGAKNDDRHQDL